MSKKTVMSKKKDLWVVYVMNIHKQVQPMNVVCEQCEWDEMEKARPGYHTLIRSGIASENEAEILARGTSGDTKSRHLR